MGILQSQDSAHLTVVNLFLLLFLYRSDYQRIGLYIFFVLFCFYLRKCVFLVAENRNIGKAFFTDLQNHVFEGLHNNL